MTQICWTISAVKFSEHYFPLNHMTQVFYQVVRRHYNLVTEMDLRVRLDLQCIASYWKLKPQLVDCTCSPIIDGCHHCHHPSCWALVSSTHTAPATWPRRTRSSCIAGRPYSRVSILIKIKIYSFTVSDVCHSGTTTTATKWDWHHTIDVPQGDWHSDPNC